MTAARPKLSETKKERERQQLLHGAGRRRGDPARRRLVAARRACAARGVRNPKATARMRNRRENRRDDHPNHLPAGMVILVDGARLLGGVLDSKPAC